MNDKEIWEFFKDKIFITKEQNENLKNLVMSKGGKKLK